MPESPTRSGEAPFFFIILFFSHLRMKLSHPFRICLIAALALAIPEVSGAQRRITTPAEQFGTPIGADYFLINYTQFLQYWDKLAKQSDRMKVTRIGTSAQGRPMMMAIVSSPANLRNLARYQSIASRLANADGLTDQQAKALAAEGKAVVWIDGGLHATEVLGSHQLVQTTYDLVSSNDAEMRRILDDVIVLLVPANPDGWELVGNWYMRDADTLKRSTTGLPVLYQHYVGHDNNRDTYMASQPETQAMDSILFRAWYPQIMYNHHQTGPAGTVMFAPPFRDPFNYNVDPLVMTELDLVGAAMHSRFIAENKPGTTMRSGANYSTWFNGGMRTTTYFHNMIGLLTETIGNPTPITIPLVPDRLLRAGITPFPITPQPWHFTQSVAYSVTANRAVLDVASRYRETFLYNIYQMGRNSIQRGSRDSWTTTPHRVEAWKQVMTRDSAEGRKKTTAEYMSMLNTPDTRDPRGYIISSNQRDFPTAVRFVNTLVKNGVTIHRATAPFQVGGKDYPPGSLIVKTAQAFRPHILDMFEPQDHPDDIPYPGAAPTPPYDNAGWTLAYQMGIEFDRVLDAFTGPFEEVSGFAKAPALGVGEAPAGGGYFVSRGANDAFVLVNRAVAAGIPVATLTGPFNVNGTPLARGSFYIAAAPGAAALVQKAASDKGIQILAGSAPPAERLVPVRPVRIALWDMYGGSMESGWTRFLFDQFEFPYKLVFAPDIDAGKLAGNYDVLILPNDATIGRTNRSRGERGLSSEALARIPAEYRGRVGVMSTANTLPRIREFLMGGGTVLAMGNASAIGLQLGLPLTDALADTAGRLIPRSKFYVPASVMRLAVDTADALAFGMKREVDVMYDNNPAFILKPGAEASGIKRIAWFGSDAPLRSGWAWGQGMLDGAAEVVSARVGKGTLFLFGPDIQFRHQSHGAFKFLFNGIYSQPGIN